MRYRLRTLLILSAGVGVLIVAYQFSLGLLGHMVFGGGLGNVPMQEGDRQEPLWGKPSAPQEGKLRQTKWNVQVLFHMDEMERAGKTEQEIDEYWKANYDKPPKDFKLTTETLVGLSPCSVSQSATCCG